MTTEEFKRYKESLTKARERRDFFLCDALCRLFTDLTNSPPSNRFFDQLQTLIETEKF